MSLKKEQKVKMMSEVTDYLRNEYGLDDDDSLDAPEVANLCETIMENKPNNKVEEMVRQVTDDIWREMQTSVPFKMDYVAEVVRQALTSSYEQGRDDAIEEINNLQALKK